MSGSTNLTRLRTNECPTTGVLSTVRSLLSDSKVLTVIFGLTLLLIFTMLYLADPDIYLRVVRIWVPESMPAPFADSAYIMGQLECWRKGIDVYASNPCDIYGRTLAYPPLWLRLWFLPSDPRASVSFGFALGIGFIVSLAVLPRLARRRDVPLLWGAIASSATAYAVERGNVDLLIFVLAAAVAVTAGRRFPVRVVGYMLAVLATLLKIYPIVLLALIARERRRVAIVIGLAALALVLASVWLWRGQWSELFANIPGPSYETDGPGGRKLPEGLLIIAAQLARHVGLTSRFYLDDAMSRRLAVAGLFPVVTLAAVFIALRLAREAKFTCVMRRFNQHESTCLTIGALLFCGCFMAGTSIAYREILLLFALPALLSFQYESDLWPLVRWTARIAIPLMWVSYPAMLIGELFGEMNALGGPVPTFAFWLMREIAWWWLFIVLAAVLLTGADQSGMVNIGRDTRRTT